MLSLEADDPGDGGGVGRRRSGALVVVSKVTRWSIFCIAKGEALAYFRDSAKVFLLPVLDIAAFSCSLPSCCIS